ncbi:hypothetical protein [Brevibacillus sp. 179-C 1.1 NHS]|uniref:hypothetical protein n=1 Tax=Brevibacillus sp. 179-C 1.1 NHS TaxID=3235177 RepID=UPI0039A0CFF6
MELDRSFRDKVVPIPYWKLTIVFILFIASFIIWNVWEAHNRLYTDNLYMKRSIFTGVMFQLELLEEPNGDRIELYSFVTSDARIDRQQMQKDNQLEFSLLESKINLLVKEERNVVFYFLFLLYTLSVWYLLRKLLSGGGLHALVFFLCVFFSVSLLRSWVKLQRSLEDITYYISRL